jgi:hypothetical protein
VRPLRLLQRLCVAKAIGIVRVRDECRCEERGVFGCVCVCVRAHSFVCLFVTLYVLSNVSYIKRVMIDVLPTASSPRKTNLYFERGRMLCTTAANGTIIGKRDAADSTAYSTAREWTGMDGQYANSQSSSQ